MFWPSSHYIDRLSDINFIINQISYFDEEGNSYSPLVQFEDRTYNVSAEKDKLTLYPCHGSF